MTVAGTTAFGELLVSAMTAPPSGAGTGTETTPVSGRPPATEPGATDNASWPIVSEVERVTPDALAVNTAVNGVGDAPMAIENVVVV